MSKNQSLSNIVLAMRVAASNSGLKLSKKADFVIRLSAIKSRTGNLNTDLIRVSIVRGKRERISFLKNFGKTDQEDCDQSYEWGSEAYDEKTHVTKKLRHGRLIQMVFQWPGYPILVP